MLRSPAQCTLTPTSDRLTRQEQVPWSKTHLRAPEGPNTRGRILACCSGKRKGRGNAESDADRRAEGHGYPCAYNRTAVGTAARHLAGGARSAFKLPGRRTGSSRGHACLQDTPRCSNVAGSDALAEAFLHAEDRAQGQGR